MKLYLSSFGLGDNPEQLVALAGESKKVLVILNALDHRDEARNRFLSSQTEALNKLGFVAEELDLRNYFGKQSELENVLKKYDLVWINGGNTFILRRAMKQSGFDVVIKELIKNNSIVYGGFSAAVCILSSSLKGLEITDDPTIVPDGYDEEIIWDGLNIINYSVAVHYDSNHHESHLTDKEILYYEENNIPYKKLRDGEVIIINE